MPEKIGTKPDWAHRIPGAISALFSEIEIKRLNEPLAKVEGTLPFLTQKQTPTNTETKPLADKVSS